MFFGVSQQNKLMIGLELNTGGPDVVFDYKTMYENTLKIALNVVLV